MQNVEKLEDPLLTSIFKQGTFIQCNESTQHIEVKFAKDFSFFQDWLENSISLWKPLLHASFGQHYSLQPSFSNDVQVPEPKSVSPNNFAAPKAAPTMAPSAAPKPKSPPTNVHNNGYKQGYVKRQAAEKTPLQRTKPINVSDEATWKKTNMVLKVFPGTVSEVQEP